MGAVPPELSSALGYPKRGFFTGVTQSPPLIQTGVQVERSSSTHLRNAPLPQGLTWQVGPGWQRPVVMPGCGTRTAPSP